MPYVPRGKIVVSYVNGEGKGVFAPDLELAPQPLASGATVRRVFESPSVPITGIAYNDKDEYGNLANKEGVTVSECEMPPGDKSPMHATPSVDFGFMISGEVTLILDSGEEKVLK
jgi:quercetin dioxygenase-like cupin family protein